MRSIKRFQRARRWTLPLATIGLIATVVLFNGFVAAFGPADSVRNRSETGGIVNITMQLQPAVVEPGQSVTLEIVATNRGNIAANPIINTAIPQDAGMTFGQLPASTTLNLQQNSLSWQPIVPAGQSRTFVLPFDVGVADIQQPLQRVEATYLNGDVAQTISAEFWVGVLPQITIQSVDTISVGQPLQVRADIKGPGPFAQKWDLGDGRTFRASNPPISYSAVGTYDLVLEVENPLGRVTTQKTIEVVPDPIALFSLSDNTPGVGQMLNFINASGGAGPMSYTWNFGDGEQAFVEQPAHIYREPGSYLVTLVAENEFGRHETEQRITVGTPPTLDMLLPASTEVGQTVIGQAFGDNSVTQYVWDLGNGRQQTGEQLSYFYQRSGTYRVTLSAVNDFGVTQLAQDVTVEPGILNNFLPMLAFEYNGQFIEDLLAAEEAAQPDFLTDFTPIDLSNTVVPLDSTPEQRLLWYINKARESVGLAELSYVETLSVAAQRHTNDMAFQRFWGHTGSDGSRPAERQQAAGYAGGYAGEATAWGFEFPSGAVQFWLESPSHRPLILNPNANEVGVAFTYDDTAPSIYYWTAEFGRNDGSYAVPSFSPPTPTPGVVPTVVPTTNGFSGVTPTPVIVVVTPTPVAEPTDIIVVATPTPTGSVKITATPIVTATAIATSTLTPTPAATQTPTATPTPSPTAIATQTPAGVLVTPTPVGFVTETPTPDVPATPTLEPTQTSTPVSIIIATSTPQPTATPESSGESNEAQLDAAEVAASLFLDAIIGDPTGIQALPHATYTMQGVLLNADGQTALQLSASLASYLIVDSSLNDTQAWVTVAATSNDGTVSNRILSLQLADGQWRVDTVQSAE